MFFEEFSEHLWMNASNEVTLKKNFDESKPSSKLTLKTKWYHSCSSCDDSRSCEQLKKRVTDTYFEKKSLTLNPNHLSL